MTDVPPDDDDAPAEAADGSYSPSGLRRSTFTPPSDAGADPAPSQTENPLHDDDELADALAAQVAQYTTPITLPPSDLPPVDAPPVDAPPLEQAPPTEVAFEPAPEPEPTGWAIDDEPAPASEEERLRSLSVAAESGSTLAAIEMLEQQLRLLDQGAPLGAAADPIASQQLVDDDSAFIPAPFGTGGVFPAESDVGIPPVVLGAAAVGAATALPEPWPMEPPPASWQPPEGLDDEPQVDEATIDSAPPVTQFAPAEMPEPAPPSTAQVFLPPPLVEPPPISSIDTDTGRIDLSELPPPPVGMEPMEPAVDASLLAPPDDGLEPVVAEPPARGDESETGAPVAAAAAGVSAAVTFDAMLAGASESPTLDSEEADVIDPIDRNYVGHPFAVDTQGVAIVTAPPSGPISTQRLAEGEVALMAPDLASPPVFEVELHGPEPTALEQRVGRSSRLFWLWFAANASVLSLALGAVQFSLGMSLRQAIVATLAGVAISFLPLGLGTLSGKWSGQPTMVVSRASFGVVGNVVPALLAVVSRVVWGSVMLWLLAVSVAKVLTHAGLDLGLGESIWGIIGLAAGAVIAGVVAFFGYGLLARVQLVLSILTGVLVAGAIVLTADQLNFGTALATGDGPWTLVLTGAVLVFSVIGLTWVHSSGDVARYQRPGSSGGASMLWATFGATLPAFLLVSWGAVLAASSPALAEGLATQPLVTLAALLPAWYPVPLLAAAGLSLLSGAVLTMYSGGFALQAAGLRVTRAIGVLIAGLLATIVAAGLLYLGMDSRTIMRDVITTISVPVAAWAGIFAAEMMIRNRRFHSGSLLRRGGIYPDARWANLIGLLVISVIGYGLTSVELAGFTGQGFLFPLLGISSDDPLATSDIGVFVALILGVATPLVFSIPGIRRQEDSKPPAI